MADDDQYVELPVELIQHIQSFLHAKDVVRASVLSKLWYNAWSTNPVLCLDELCLPARCFPPTGRFEFYDFARRTIDRYRISKTNIYSFSLTLYLHEKPRDVNLDSFNDLILTALTLGADLDLTLGPNGCNQLLLPDQVFSSIYLKKLCVCKCYIVLPQSNGKSRILCSRLVSLELLCVRVSDDTMRDILLGCPLMEDLRVERCNGLKKINLSVIRCNLKTFQAHGKMEPRILLVEWVGKNTPGLRDNMQHQFHNLISLKLSRVDVDPFFKFFSHGFPCLEKLELEECIGPVINIDIVSDSLRYLSLIRIDGLNFANVQALNIQNFRFESSSKAEDIPSLSFHTISKKWKSDLKFFHPRASSRGVSWLLKIRDILRELSLSKISIAVVFSSDDHYLGSITEEIIQSNHISTFVKNLRISMSPWKLQISFGLLLNLLCCRPKYLTRLGFSKQYNYEMLELAYNELKKHENKNLTDALPCIHGLEEVDMEHYHQTLREWRPIQPGTEEAADIEGEFRLRLKWMDQKAT